MRALDGRVKQLGLVVSLAAGAAVIILASAGKASPAQAAELEIQPPPAVAQGILRVPTVTVAIHNDAHESATTVPVGTQVHARVRVSGSAATPTGQVAITWYANGTCTSPFRVSSSPPSWTASRTRRTGPGRRPLLRYR